MKVIYRDVNIDATLFEVNEILRLRRGGPSCAREMMLCLTGGPYNGYFAPLEDIGRRKTGMSGTDRGDRQQVYYTIDMTQFDSPSVSTLASVGIVEMDNANSIVYGQIAYEVNRDSNDPVSYALNIRNKLSQFVEETLNSIARQVIERTDGNNKAVLLMG